MQKTRTLGENFPIRVISMSMKKRLIICTNKNYFMILLPMRFNHNQLRLMKASNKILLIQAPLRC